MAVTDASILPLLIARMQPQLPWNMSPQGRPMWEPTAPGATFQGTQPVVPALSSRLPANLPLNTMPIRQVPQVSPEFTLQAMGQLRQPQLPPAAYPDMAPPPAQPPQVAAAPQQDVPRGTPLGYGQPDALMGYKPQTPDQGQQPQSNALLYGLLAAGLGMLANNYGKYGQAGPPIGQGGLTGLNTFLGQRQQEEENARRQQLAQQQGEYQRGQLEVQGRRADIDEQRMRAYENLVTAQAGDYRRKAALFEEKNRLVGSIIRETDPAKRRELETQLGLLDNASQTLGNMWDIETQEIKEGAGAGQVRNILIDKRTGKPIYTGTPYKQFSDQPLVSIGTTAPSGPTGQMPSDIDFSAATGGSGFFGGAINTLTDAFGAGLAFPKTEEALRALDNLKVRTVTLLQSAIPGRPSNYLMQTLEKLSVSPGSLFQGDERAYTTLSETKRLISEEVKRMDGLLGTGMLTKGDVSNIVSNRTQLSALEKDYEHVLSNWSAKSNKKRATPEEIWERIQKEKNK